MPVTYVSSSYARNGNTNTNITVTAPSGLVMGNILIAYCYAAALGTWTAPTGWTKYTTFSGDSSEGTLTLFYKYVSYAESTAVAGTINYVFNGPAYETVEILQYSGVAGFDTFGAFTATDSNNSLTTGAISATSNNETQLVSWHPANTSLVTTSAPATNYILSDSPYSYWTLGDAVGSSSAANSAQGGTLTSHGTVTFGSTGLANTGTSAAFDGTTGYLMAPSGDGSVNSMSQFSAECWVYSTDNSAYRSIMGVRDSGGSGWEIANSTGYLNFTCDSHSTLTSITATIPLALNTWTHVAVNWDGSNVHFYINGELHQSAARTVDCQSTYFKLFMIGARYNVTPQNFFKGSVTHAAVFNYALSVGQIYNHYSGLLNTTPLSGPTPTLTTGGTAGTTSYEYELTYQNQFGESLPGPATTINTGNATLNGTNYNKIQWAMPSQNTVYNSSFEDGTLGSAAIYSPGNATISNVTTQAHTGTHSISVNVIANNTTTAGVFINPAASVMAGTQYVVSAWVLMPVGQSFIAGPRTLNSVGSDIGENGGQTFTGTGRWQRVSVPTMSVTQGVNMGMRVVVLANQPTSVTFYVDDFQIEYLPNQISAADASLESGVGDWTGIGENLLSDPSFESGISDWSSVSHCTIASSSVTAYDGTKCMSMTCDGAGTAVTYTNGLPLQTRYIQPGYLYTATVYIKASTVPRNVGLNIGFLNASKSTSSTAVGSIYSDNVNGWTQLTVQGVADANAVFAEIYVLIYGAGASEVHYVDAAGLFQQPIISGAGQNLINNSDFEIDVLGGTAYSNVTASQSNVQAYTGIYSNLISITANHGVHSCYLTTSNPMRTVIGQQYTFSAWLYVPTGVAGSFYIEVNSTNLGAQYSTTAIANSTWQRLSITFTATDIVTNVYIINSVSVLAGAYFYVDSIKFEMGSTATAYVPPVYHNLLKNPSFENGTTNGWGSLANTTSQTVNTDGGYIGSNYWRHTANGSGQVGPFYAGSTILQLVPGQWYTWSIYVRPSVTQLIKPRIEWHTAENSQISVINGTSVSCAANIWTRVSVTGQAPTGTDFANSTCYTDSTQTPANGETIDYDCAQFELGQQLNPYIDGSLGSGLSWVNSNNLCTNPSFETNTNGWVAGAENLVATANDSDFETGIGSWVVGSNCTIAQNATVANTGTYSLSLTASSAASMWASTPFNVIPNQLHTLSCFVRAATVSRQARIQVNWYDSTNTYISTTYGSVDASNVVSWNQLIYNVIPPTNAVTGKFIVFFLNTAASEVHYVDSVGIYETPIFSGNAVNLIDNNDFELDLTGWSNNGLQSVSMAVSAGAGFTGGYSLAATTGTNTGTQTVYTTTSDLLPGTYTFSAWVNVPSSATPVQLTVVNITGSISGTTTSSSTNSGTWTRLSVTFNVVTTAQLHLHVSTTTTPISGKTTLVDAVKLEMGSSATAFVPQNYANLVYNPSFDTDLTNWTANVNTGAGDVAPTTSLVTNDSPAGSGTNTIDVVNSSTTLHWDYLSSGTITNLIPGQYYTLSFYAKLMSGASSGYYASIKNGAGSDSAGFQLNFTPTGSWQRFSQTFLCASTYVSDARVYIAMPTTAAFEIRFSAFQLELGQQMNPYIDGAQGAGLAWDVTQNLVTTNAGFESGVSGYSVANGATLTSSTAQAWEGTHSCQVNCANTTAQNGLNVIVNNLAPGTTYTFSAWIYNPSSGGPSGSTQGIQLSIQGAAITAPDPGTPFSYSINDKWFRLNITFQTNSSGGSISCYILSHNTTGTEIFYVDAVQLEQLSYATYFNGTGNVASSSSSQTVPWGVTNQLGNVGTNTGGAATVDGAKSANIQASGNSNLWSRGYLSYAVTLAPNETYTASGTWTSYQGAYLLVDGPAVNGPQYITLGGGTNGQYRSAITFSTNSTGGTAYIRFCMNNTTTPGNYFSLDAVQLEQRLYCTPYNSGTANASPSTQAPAWGLKSAQPIFTTTSQAYDATTSLGVSNSLNPQYNSNFSNYLGASLRLNTLNPNTTYTLSLQHFSYVNNFVLIDGPGISSAVTTATVGSDNGSWNQTVAVFTTNATNLSIYIRWFAQSKNASCYIDSIYLCEGSTLQTTPSTYQNYVVNVYGRTAGSLKLLHGSPVYGLTWSDTGNILLSNTPPTTDTSYPHYGVPGSLATRSIVANSYTSNDSLVQEGSLTSLGAAPTYTASSLDWSPGITSSILLIPVLNSSRTPVVSMNVEYISKTLGVEFIQGTISSSFLGG